MSIAEFSVALKDKANKAAAGELANMQNRLLAYSSSLLSSRNAMNNAASILTVDSAKFRSIGEQQGRTRLVLTKESIANLISSFAPGIPPNKGIELYLEFLTSSDKFSKLKAKHFEVYDSTGTNILPTTGTKKISNALTSSNMSEAVAFRGLNFSHSNTLGHIVEFLKYIGAFKGVSAEEAKSQITSLYERGHIYAQTTGKQVLSLGGVSSDSTNILDRLITLSKKLDIASSSISNKPIYSQLDAAIQKDFTAGKIFMNIEFQEKYHSDGIGNQDTGKITKGLQLISSLMKLLTAEYDSRGTKLIGIPKVGSVNEAAKALANIAKKIDTYSVQMEKVLAGYMENPGSYIADLKSSDSLNDFIASSITNTISGKKVSNIKVSHKNVPIVKKHTFGTNIPKVSSLITELQKTKSLLLNTKKAATGSLPTIRNQQGQFYSLANLQVLLNANLQHVIAANMGDGAEKRILNYRTGRFAGSANVTKLTQSREGMITAFYTYMKNPYQTFEPGFKQGSPRSRDPKLLIAKSIAEIAATKVANRMRAVLV